MVAVSFEQFAAELKAFSGRGEIINEIRKDMRKPLPELRKKVRAAAIAMLPARGGLGRWVAAAKFSVRFRDSGRSAGISVKVSRKTEKDRAALDPLDTAGRVRHPLYGNRRHWYPQQVAALFFTGPWEQMDWVGRADRAMDRALDKIRRG